MSGKSAAFSSANQHPVLPEFSGKWGTDCLNSRFSPLHAGYSIKLRNKLYMLNVKIVYVKNKLYFLVSSLVFNETGI